MDQELRSLRSAGCSFEQQQQQDESDPYLDKGEKAISEALSPDSSPAKVEPAVEHGPQNRSDTERTLQVGHRPPEGWRRAEGLPSWNGCFRCLFSCGTYRAPEDSIQGAKELCESDFSGPMVRPMTEEE